MPNYVTAARRNNFHDQLSHRAPIDNGGGVIRLGIGEGLTNVYGTK